MRRRSKLIDFVEIFYDSTIFLAKAVILWFFERTFFNLNH